MHRISQISLIILLFAFSCRNSNEKDINQIHLDNIAECINNDLLSIKKEVVQLTNEFQYKIPFNKDYERDLSDTYYEKHGVLYTDYFKNRSAVYFPSFSSITPYQKQIIANTEIMDSFFINAVENNLFLSQVYFIDTNSFLRIYPYTDIINYLKNPVDLRNLAAYKLVENKPFIENQCYWIKEPVADPYGRGWVVSCVNPVYYRDKFIGSVTGDIQLRNLENKYFSSNNILMILTTSDGRIICSTSGCSKITMIPAYKEFQYYKPIWDDIFITHKTSLLEHKNKNLRKTFRALFGGKSKEDFYYNNKKYTIFKSHIKETDWFLFKIIH